MWVLFSGEKLLLLHFLDLLLLAEGGATSSTVGLFIVKVYSDLRLSVPIALGSGGWRQAGADRQYHLATFRGVIRLLLLLEEARIGTTTMGVS